MIFTGPFRLFTLLSLFLTHQDLSEKFILRRTDRRRNHSICLSLWCTTTIKGGHHQDQSHIWPWRKHTSNWTSFDIYSGIVLHTYKYVLKSSCTGMTGCMVAQNPNKNYFLLSKPSTSCVWTKGIGILHSVTGALLNCESY